MRRLVTAALAVCAAACGPLEEAAVPRIALSAPGTAAAEQALRRDDDGIIIMNGLSPQSLGENLLTTNPTNRAELIGRPLTTASFTTAALHDAVQYDARAQEVLKYVVRCALSPADAPVSVAGQTFTGELGLCPAWASGAIAGDAVCQRRVTACLLALSNAVGVHVPVSIRGLTVAGGPVLTPAAAVRPSPYTDAGTLDPLFSGCGGATAGVRHNCGWQPMDDAVAHAAGIDRVFSCAPGAWLRVGAGSACTGSTLGSTTPGSDKVLRVCAGIGPCRGPTSLEPVPPNYLAQAQNDSCGTIKPEVIFQCPAGGQYVVMQRDYYVASPPGPRGTITVGQLGSRGPAPETALFPAREGAFFGSLFTGPLGRTVTLGWSPTQTPVLTTTLSGKVVYPGAFSCEDALFRDEEAYRTARLCTLSRGDCLSTATGICQGDATHARVCDAIGGAVDTGFFFACRSPSGLKYDEALTTFLRTPCDLIGGSAACKQEN